MRLSSSYKTLNRVAQARVRRLRALGLGAVTLTPPEANRLLSYVAVEALNLWSLFVRSYTLSLALRPSRCAGGRIALSHPGISVPHDILIVAMALLRPMRPPSATGTWSRRDEPAWHDTHSLLRCATFLGTSNLADVQAALSIGSRVFNDLPVFRNFFGHRNATSYQAASSLALHYAIPVGHPGEILRARPAGRPYPLMVDWIDDLGVVIDLLCQ